MDELLAGLATLLEDERWKRDALCVEHADVEFFVERGESADPAKAICRRCMVREECLDYALEHGIAEGVWGGLSGRERRQHRQQAA